MILYYKGNRIIKISPDAEYYRGINSSDYSEFYIDEDLEANHPVCADLETTAGQTDYDGNNKYYIDDDGDLAVVDGWTPYDLSLDGLL